MDRFGEKLRATSAVYFIAGDNVPLIEMWSAMGKYGVSHWPSAIHADLEAYFKSLRRMETLGDIILPGYKWSVPERVEYK